MSPLMARNVNPNLLTTLLITYEITDIWENQLLYMNFLFYIVTYTSRKKSIVVPSLHQANLYILNRLLKLLRFRQKIINEAFFA